MSYKVFTTPDFEKSVKPIYKRQRSLKADLNKLIESLEEEPTQGIKIRENCYKIRMAITSKGRGKSGGARVFTYVKVVEEAVYLAQIIDKSDKDSISETELNRAFDYIDKLENPNTEEE